MKINSIFLFIVCILFVGCELDSFLFNTKEIENYQLPNNTIPDSLVQQVTLDSDGNKLYGYWVSSKNSENNITILYCHGNKYNMDEYWDRVMILHALEVNIFIFDYRGYGRSEGSSSEEGLYKDGESALNFLLETKKIPPEAICLYGYSLGNVVSIYLAAEKIHPLCLIAEAPFASANSLTQGSLGLDIPELWLTQGKFNNVEKVKQINTPFLLFHGEEDDFVRFRDNGKIIFENAPQPKSLVQIPNANHNNVPEKLGISEYQKKIKEWIVFSKNLWKK